MEEMVTEYEISEELKHMLRIVSLEKEVRQREEGLKEDEQFGKKAGLIAAKQETFLQILEFKFSEISDVIPEMIRVIDDLDELKQWINRALLAETLNDIWEQSTNEDEIKQLSPANRQQLITND